MKKILIRGGMSPYDNEDVFDIMVKNKIGSNNGNLLYLNGVFKSLQTSETELFVDNYTTERTKKDYDKIADYINNNYDKFIIPLANAFRKSFIGHIVNMTEVIKRLKIPCIVIGVGVQGDVDTAYNFSFDNEVKEFVKQVLNKSYAIGVRGEITANYLNNLGFKNNIIKIGCPSMFFYGNSLKKNKKNDLKFDSKIAFNFKNSNDARILNFFDDYLCLYQNSYVIPQHIIDLKMIYLGLIEDKYKNIYPIQSSNRIFLQNRTRFFVNIHSWFEFLSDFDFSLGTCIHGTIAAIQAGIPAVLIVIDSRTRELAEFHNIPHIYPNELENKSLVDIYKKTNFDSIYIGHGERLENYINFLKLNELSVTNSFDESSSPYNIKLNNISSLQAPVECYSSIDGIALSQRLELYHGCLNKKIITLDNKIKTFKKDINNISKKLK